MIVRIGIPACFGTFGAVAREMRAPVMVSANAFWRAGEGRFRPARVPVFAELDLALDSAGFVAMARYGGYPWSLGDYVDFAGRMKPTWWAAPDYCCEPEISRDRAEVVDRVRRTAFKLEWCRVVALDRGVSAPLPVVQGWRPDDYELCLSEMDELPALIGVGSVCRRPLGGADGIMAIVGRLDRVLPAGVMLHLFGVKGDAIAAMRGHPRVFSTDSQAWDYAARRERVRNGVGSATVAYRSGYMRSWYQRQVA